MWNPKHEAERAGRKAVEKVVEPAGKRVVDTVIKPAEKAAASAIWDARSKAWHKITDTGKATLSEIQDAREEALEAIKHDLPELVQQAAKELAEEASRKAQQEALDNAVWAIEMTQPDVYGLIVGVEAALLVQGEVTVTVELPNPLAKLGFIRALAQHPPRGRAAILEAVDELAGDGSVTAEAKVSGNGGFARWQAGDKIEKLGRFLEHHGVE